MEVGVGVDVSAFVVDGRIDGDFADVAKEHADVGAEDVVYVVAGVVVAAAAQQLVVVRLAYFAVDQVWAVVELAAVALGACMVLAIPIYQAALYRES